MNDTTTNGNGFAVITDPTSHDSITLATLTKADLFPAGNPNANIGDFRFV